MGHTFSKILIRAVFSTKLRANLINADLRPRLYEYLAGVARNEFGHAIEIGGTADHIHGLIALRTDVSIADAMCKWKSLSSGWVHKTFPAQETFARQSGYGAFSVSESNVDAVRSYLRDQEPHHRKMSFEDELRALLNRHELAYDPKRFLD